MLIGKKDFRIGLGSTTEVSFTTSGIIQSRNTETGKLVGMDYYDLSLLAWVAYHPSVAPIRLDRSESTGFYAARLRRLLRDGVLQTFTRDEDPKISQDDLMAECRKDWPVFIIGSYRSGTTLLRYVIDAHPRLACPPESKFIPGLQEAIDFPEAMLGLRSLGFTPEDMMFELRRVAEAVLGSYARRMGKLRWVEKTPNYFRHVGFLDALFGGEVSYIILIRNPLDCVESLERSFPDEGLNHADPEVARKVRTYGKGRYGWAQFWQEVYSKLLTILTALPSRAYLVKYEDLVAEPTYTVAQLLAFIGEEFPSDLIRNAFAYHHTEGPQDPNIKRTNEIHKNSLRKWTKWSAGETKALWEIVGQTAAAFGYTDPLCP
jgi:protein-tyrosine sulfotransferase